MHIVQYLFITYTWMEIRFTGANQTQPEGRKVSGPGLSNDRLNTIIILFNSHIILILFATSNLSRRKPEGVDHPFLSKSRHTLVARVDLFLLLIFFFNNVGLLISAFTS